MTGFARGLCVPGDEDAVGVRRGAERLVARVELGVVGPDLPAPKTAETGG
jgi:hypothetical protein